MWHCSFITTLLKLLVDRITTVNNHSCALHKACFAASQEQNAVCHFLGTSHAAQWRDTHGRLEDFGVGFGHRRVNHTRTNAVDADQVFGVLRLGISGQYMLVPYVW